MVDQVWKAVFETVLGALPSCCDECRRAPGSDQRKEAAKVTLALRQAGFVLSVNPQS